MKEVSVSGKLVIKDVVTFMFYHNYSRLGGKLTAFLGLIGLVLAPYFFINSDILSGIIFTSLTVMYVIVTPLDFYTKANRQIHMNPVFKNKMTFIFTESTLRVKLYTGSSEVTWNDVIKVVPLKEIILIYIQESHALIVPKRNFKSIQDVTSVVELIDQQQLKLSREKRIGIEVDGENDL